MRGARNTFLASLSSGRPMSADKANMLLLLATCALVLLPHVGALPLWVTPACAALMVWRAWVTFRGNRLPPRWLLSPLAALAIAGVVLTYRTLFGREAGVAMLALLLALKLLEIRAKRDLFVVLFLCFFLQLASFFHSQSIAAAALTVLAVIAILSTQLSFQYTGAIPPLTRRVRLGATIVALAIPLTLVLFVFFPRINSPLWGTPKDAYGALTGLSETMSPGNISRLAQSDAIAFRARFEGPVPDKSRLYWRGIVMGEFDGRTWRPPSQPLQAAQPVQIALRGPAVPYQITLEPHGKHWLFVLDVPRELPRIEGNAVNVASALQLLSAQPINSRIRYDAVSHVDYVLQASASSAALSHWLRLPAGFNPRARELALRLRAETGDAEAAIDAVLGMFREQPFRYTLEPPLLGPHSVDAFLFDTQAGFCEHYSGAFVVLMRAMGIPARVVTGYQGGTINPTDGYLTVRQSDAHAWAEVWLHKRGWVRVDPTAAVAPERIEQNLASLIPPTALGGLMTLDASKSMLVTQWLRLRHGWEALNNSWNQLVLSYTLDRQRDMLRRLGFERGDWAVLAGLLGVGMVISLAITALLTGWRQKRHDPLEALYQSLCHKMARRGLPRMPHEAPRTYSARLTAPESPLEPRQKAAVARFLSAYEALRYGVPITPITLAQLKNLLSECR